MMQLFYARAVNRELENVVTPGGPRLVSRFHWRSNAHGLAFITGHSGAQQEYLSARVPVPVNVSACKRLGKAREPLV